MRLDLVGPSLTVGDVRLPIAERNATADQSAWAALPATAGTLRRPRREPVLRWVSPDGRQLVCLYTVDRPDRRLTVVPGLDFLTAQGEVTGWLLHEPADHIDCTPELVRDYFLLLTAETFERMDAEDETVLTALRALADRAGPHPAMSEHLVDLIDFFYA